LDSVDLTTPLRADEVFTVLKHREVQSTAKQTSSSSSSSNQNASAFAGLVDTLEAGEPEGKKKSKKGKDKDGHKDKEKEKDAKHGKHKDKSKDKGKDKAVDDGTAPKVKKSSKSAASSSSSNAVDDLLGLGYSDLTSPTTAAASSSSSASMSMAAAMSGQGLGMGMGMGAGTEKEKDKEKKSKKHSSGAAEDPAMSVFAPHVLDAEGFAIMLGKSSSRWASGSVTLRYDAANTKAKHVFKAIAARLHAHQVESESSKACSLCAKHVSGSGYLCVLAKVSKDGGTANVDVKCLLGSKQESQSAVDSVVASLSNLSL
jgi:hypothetical protein